MKIEHMFKDWKKMLTQISNEYVLVQSDICHRKFLSKLRFTRLIRIEWPTFIRSDWFCGKLRRDAKLMVRGCTYSI